MTIEYTPEPGTWRLIAPSGVEYTGTSPMHALQAEQRARMPADVAMGRVMAALAPSIEDAQDLADHMALISRYGEECEKGKVSSLLFREIEKSARRLMGLTYE